MVLFEPDPSLTRNPEQNVLHADVHADQIESVNPIHRQGKVSGPQVTIMVTVNEPADHFIALSIGCLVYK